MSGRVLNTFLVAINDLFYQEDLFQERPYVPAKDLC